MSRGPRTAVRLVAPTATLMLALQAPVLLVLCVLVAATLNPWFFLYLPLFLAPALVVGAAAFRATNRISEPWRGWAWIDIVLNCALLLAGTAAWWWSRSISLDDMDSTQAFWLTVSAVWLVAIAWVIVLVGWTILRSRHP